MHGVELRNLRLQDINLETKKIAISRSKLSTSTRTVVMTNDAYKAVLRLVDRAAKLNATKPKHFLFPYKIRKGIGYDPSKPVKGWRTAWRKLTKDAGLPGFRFMTSDTPSLRPMLNLAHPSRSFRPKLDTSRKG